MKHLGILTIFLLSFTSDDNTGIELMNKMIKATSEIKGLKVTIEMKERIDGKFNNKKSDFKIRNNPLCIYLLQEYPKKGMEILYREKQNDNRALINPNGFPWVTLSLDPNGEAMHEDYHHTITTSGFSYFTDITKYMLQELKNNAGLILEYQGKVRIDDKICYKVSFQNPNFKFIRYNVKPGESLLSIAWKNHVNEYMILENNKKKISYHHAEPGTTLSIPNSYAKDIIIYLYEKDFFPYKIKIYDHIGLFEEYTYSNLIVNPVFDNNEFDPENKLYDF